MAGMQQAIVLGTAMALFGAVLSSSSSSSSSSSPAYATCNTTTDGEPIISWDEAENRLSVTSGCATMVDIVDMRTVDGKNVGPLYHFSESNNWYSDSWTGTYYLEADLYVESGAKLSVDGSNDKPSQCETLYLASNNSAIVNLRAYGGQLDIRYTRIFSWDLAAGDYDKYPEQNGRSHINAITEVITGRSEDECGAGEANLNMGRATMNIHRSEVAYLGYQGSEAYGISYKARGLCNDLSNLDIFDDNNGLNVEVLGDIYRSDLHHNWFGVYSWGHGGGDWRRNEVHHNHGYGFDPHDDSDHVTIIDNNVYENGWHGIIASKRCNDVVVRGNTVYNNGQAGIMMHCSCDYATIRENIVHDNGDAGIVLVESSSCNVYGNSVYSNEYGVRLSNGAKKNHVFDNEMVENKLYEILTYKGSDPQLAESNEDGISRYNQFYRNSITPRSDQAMYIKEADSNVFRSNEFLGGTFALFTDSEKNLVIDNKVPSGFQFRVKEGSCFKEGSQASPICSR